MYWCCVRTFSSYRFFILPGCGFDLCHKYILYLYLYFCRRPTLLLTDEPYANLRFAANTRQTRLPATSFGHHLQLHVNITVRTSRIAVTGQATHRRRRCARLRGAGPRCRRASRRCARAALRRGRRGAHPRQRRRRRAVARSAWGFTGTLKSISCTDDNRPHRATLRTSKSGGRSRRTYNFGQNTNTITNTKYTCGARQIRNKLLADSDGGIECASSHLQLQVVPLLSRCRCGRRRRNRRFAADADRVRDDVAVHCRRNTRFLLSESGSLTE